MACIINASTSAGLVQSADTSGILQLQSNGTTIATVSSTGIASTGTAKAWLQLSGSATPTINGSLNISSITRNSAGDYAINFTTAMASINYSAVVSTTIDSASSNYMTAQSFAKTAAPYYLAPTTSSFGVTFVTSGGIYKDPYYASIAVFGA